MAGLVNFAGLEEEGESFEGESFLFFTLWKRDLILSVLEATSISNP